MKKKQDRQNENDYNDVTIADMNVEGMPWHQSEKTVSKKRSLIALELTKQERKAMIRGAFKAYLPMFLIIIGCFVFVYLAFYLLVTLR
ncbi:MAG: hypothetical protein PHC62_03590 [Candidatus Izemoplasmatales bacterium]|jgi:hypothetical protein|nr:hypothetical protein [Candidatus Izemoplasmatales bacterium]